MPMNKTPNPNYPPPRPLEQDPFKQFVKMVGDGTNRCVECNVFLDSYDKKYCHCCESSLTCVKCGAVEDSLYTTQCLNCDEVYCTQCADDCLSVAMCDDECSDFCCDNCIDKGGIQ